jgi:D-alanyl-D-alanine carboxypeptidase/D-alanyl-D-alanine-endopeptidase (penicillin-binding protein 4)
MRKTCTLLIVLFIFVQGVHAQITKSAAKLALENEINTLKKDVSLKHAAWSVYVYNITTSETEADYNSQMSLMPASIQKTITTSTALALLGTQFKFETKLQYTGTIDTVSGILHGNLYITGGGDPTLGSKRFGSSTNADTIMNQFARCLILSLIHI